MRLQAPLQCLLLGALLLPTAGRAAVDGQCSTCHSMHASQDGNPLAAGPQDGLMNNTCVGCHTNSGTDTIVTIGTTRIPIVFNTSAPTYPPNGSSSSALAGGNFYWVVNNGDEYGHNVYGISGHDARLNPSGSLSVLAPGGHTGSGCAGCHSTLANAASGCEACHIPQHHADDSATVVGQTGGWYRFLGSRMSIMFGETPPTSAGVKGIEDEDWEQNPSATNHNSYFGASAPAGHFTLMDTSSINQKCQGCHGSFHESAYVSSGGVWIRHPVDTAIPNSGEFTGYTTYNPMVPVARPGLVAGDKDDSTVALGSDVVACISCHRAHGSPYPAMLRWDYRGWPGNGATNGCHVCHTSKD